MIPRSGVDFSPKQARLLRGAVLGIIGALSTFACDRAPADVRSAVQLLAEAQGQGELADQAHRELKPLGARALPYLESALHRALPPGRRHLIAEIRRLAESDPAIESEAAPLLAHFAAYDAESTVRREAYAVLTLWSTRRRPLGEAARAWLRKTDEVRSED